MLSRDVRGARGFSLATCSVTMTAEARVRASFDRYFSWAMKVRSPGSARSMPATRRISASPSPSQAAVQPIRKLAQLQSRLNLKSEII